MTRQFIAIDWGTSNFRAFLVDAGTGECLDTRRSEAGLKALSTDEFPHYCHAQIVDWRNAGGGEEAVPVYLAGMVGSRNGWCEAPQLELPVDLDTLVDELMPAPGLSNAWIVPGVKMVTPDHVDVMRGEEVQAFGALMLAGRDSGACCLPGTHSKWAHLEGGRMQSFTTMMTGELYHAVRFHTLPGQPAISDAAFDAEAFHQGVNASGHEDGILHALFEARSRHLYGGLDAPQVASFLSGVLIGGEVRAALRQAGQWRDLLLVGSTALNESYRLAMDPLGMPSTSIDSDKASIAGLQRIDAIRTVRAH
ncbi:2-dehydro-3-deoxygalactonokinase [Aidingimonas halophila]|uniref:2-keto-3-deoxygalactonate kinase n=1 Tax=Aidingimonas halophila TaxID=574349 RepID=A0A1H2RZH9_9GAMM|nr:2-dehydro-3-deoxygalactonokinase [Aidingimonas halophila]GHC18476.1 2-dehydro-3-deoxygalactonokinase [Aidingimonas halophila]SDW24851.1 2-keto-3-deoxygalactonate kinase [Aidingimonas halophila]